jgi:hypothetical protein
MKQNLQLSGKNEHLPDTSNQNADYQPAWVDKLKKAMGTCSREVATTLLEQVMAGSFRSNSSREQQLLAAYDMLVEMAPEDPLESMLGAQMIAVHFQAMELMRQAAVCSIPESSRLYLNLSTKLMRAYAQQMEAFRKNRQKGRQEIRVEHINISGGQTILGNVAHPGVGDRYAESN